MGLFDAFKKKECSICGGEIGLLGNRKLEDGNMCKECAKKLSPWFEDRRSSTVAEIEQQLAYREKNREAVAAFNITRSLGDDTKVLLDEDACKFMVTDARKLEEANPDVLDFTQVTGCELDIEEDADEEMREDNEGNSVSYNPPRYNYSYDFNMVIRVNHPYFDEMRFRLNSSSVETTNGTAVPAIRKPNPRLNHEYREYEDMGKEIKEVLTQERQRARDEAKAAAAPKAAVTCPYCGATTTPDVSGCCEYCGGAVNG
ncbi:MAG: DUF4428 domain-containing protein [Ruminococcaceae bacterium]|nr:DUF4428 domain-containing protein [Oscillospiraceae bacterium]